MTTQLVVMLDKQVIKRLAVKGTAITIGRHPRSDIHLPDRTISTNHAHIKVVREDCFLEDLDSTNGTYVNFQQVEQHLLEDGDVIGISKYQIFFHTTHGAESQIRRLSIHPKLLDKNCKAWLKVLNGRKMGHFIPLGNEKITLGNDGVGLLQIEPTEQGYRMTQTHAHHTQQTRLLYPGDELSIDEITLQFLTHNTNNAEDTDDEPDI